MKLRHSRPVKLIIDAFWTVDTNVYFAFKRLDGWCLRKLKLDEISLGLLRLMLIIATALVMLLAQLPLTATLNDQQIEQINALPFREWFSLAIMLLLIVVVVMALLILPNNSSNLVKQARTIVIGWMYLLACLCQVCIAGIEIAAIPSLGSAAIIYAVGHLLLFILDFTLAWFFFATRPTPPKRRQRRRSLKQRVASLMERLQGLPSPLPSGV